MNGTKAASVTRGRSDISGVPAHFGVPASLLPERNHVLATVALAFLAGCRLAVYLQPGAWMWLACLAGVALAAFLRWLGKSAAIGLFLCALMLGALRAGAALAPAQPAPGRYEVCGYVYGEPRLRSGDRISFTLDGVTLNGAPQPGRAYCSVYYGKAGPPQLFDGAALRFEGRVYLPEGRSGAPHMDFRLWMLQNGMRFGIASSNELSVTGDPHTAPARDVASRVRAGFQSALEKTMGDEARVAMAMLLSDREGLREEENEAFQTLGIAHVMSVSGLHVGLLGGLLILLLDGLRLRRGWQFPIVAAFLAGYCALTGSSAAALRASVMLVLALVARMLGRKPDPLATLSAAMLAVLLISPLQAFSAGFALSFSAVAGILLLYPALLGALRRVWPERATGNAKRHSLLRRALGALRRWVGGPRELLALSLSAQLGVLLPTAMVFHRLPLYGVLINLVIVPYVGLLVPVYGAALLLSAVPLAGAAVGAVAAGMSRGLLLAVRLLCTLPCASVRVPSAPMAVAVGLALCLIIFSRRMRAGTGRRLLAAGLVCVLGFSGAYAARPSNPRYVQLAVGQADAALLTDGAQTVAIDVGDDGMAVADYLLAEGRDLDALYLTHLHADHAAGVTYLLESGVRVGRVYLPVNALRQRVDPQTLAVVERLREAGVPVTELAAGDEQRYCQTRVRVLWPVGETARAGQNANDLPLVLAIDFGGYTILNMSDLPGAYERYAAVPCDVLKAGHHGSDDSTGDAFLDFVCPRVALVSCSSGSRSLPGNKLLQRLEDRGIGMCRTDETGDVSITLKDGQLLITPYKARRSQ